jgi:hypothetical protein
LRAAKRLVSAPSLIEDSLWGHRVLFWPTAFRQTAFQMRLHKERTMPMALPTRLMIAALAAVSLPSLALAQEAKVVEKTVNVSAGKPAQIGVFGRITPECDNGKVQVRLAKPAVNGTVTARPGKLKQGVVKKCPALTPDVAAVFYQANAGFTGEDSAVIEVETDDGRIERHQYTIKVQ